MDKIRFADLWRTTGTIDRGPYVLIGCVAFLLKHNLDRLVASLVFHRPWGVFNYWIPLQNAVRITSLSRADVVFLETMVLLALPFIWIGVAFSIRRLRSAGLPTPLVCLFFIPYLNLLFFLLLGLLPARLAEASDRTRDSILTRIAPESAFGSAALAIALTVPFGVGAVCFGVNSLGTYGWGIFVALPFTMGLAAGLIFGLRQPRSLAGCIQVACLSVGLMGAALLALAFEGMICLLMATPIAVPLAALGGAFAYLIQKQLWSHRAAPVLLSSLLVFVPGVQFLEHKAAITPPVYAVHTSIDVQASPEAVWAQVVAFSQIPPPQELLFRAGIAYPIRAEIHGAGPGAERHCVFSTGAFVEPIEIWDAPHLLKFSVTSNPSPMQEWTPYSNLDAPHLHGFLVSNGGQFLLTPLRNGGTRLEGTTWYRHSLWPAAYWRIWSDAIIHRIHWRVLSHIKEEAEKRG